MFAWNYRPQFKKSKRTNWQETNATTTSGENRTAINLFCSLFRLHDPVDLCLSQLMTPASQEDIVTNILPHCWDNNRSICDRKYLACLPCRFPQLYRNDFCLRQISTIETCHWLSLVSETFCDPCSTWACIDEGQRSFGINWTSKINVLRLIKLF